MHHARILIVVAATLAASPAAATGLGACVDLQTDSKTTILGETPLQHRGTVVAAGDLDGDGIPDLVVGNRGDQDDLIIDVLRGPIAPGVRDMASGPGDIRLTTTGGSQDGYDATATLVADLNADGWPDLAFGTPYLGSVHDPSRKSCVRVMYGPIALGPHDIEARTDLVVLASTSSPSVSFLGFDMVAADVNQDGLPDLVMGEFEARCGAASTSTCGRVHVLLGPLALGVRDLAAVPAELTFSGVSNDDAFGFAVSVGDLSGDGMPDLAASAPSADAGVTPNRDRGAVYVVRGPFSPGSFRDLSVEPAETTFYGERDPPAPWDALDRLGQALSVGDVTGDGRPDLVVGSSTADGTLGQDQAGQVDVIAGPIPLFHGKLDLAATHARIRGAEAQDILGYDVLTTDLSADGALDLVVGSFHARGACGVLHTGVAHVFLNPLEPGLHEMSMQLSDVELNGWHEGQACGYAPAAADLDGDGLPELLVTCVRTDVGAPPLDEAGTVHLVDVASALCSATPCCGGVDTTPPVISALSVDPATLWPPNHRLVEVSVLAEFDDECDPAPVLRLVSATSNEPDDARGVGDGHTTNDVQGADVGTDDRTVRLRAERDGTGSGRTYTLTYEARDVAGNVATASVDVVVPHDVRRGAVRLLPPRSAPPRP